MHQHFLDGIAITILFVAQAQIQQLATMWKLKKIVSACPGLLYFIFISSFAMLFVLHVSGCKGWRGLM